jgi:hypothetical protein
MLRKIPVILGSALEPTGIVVDTPFVEELNITGDCINRHRRSTRLEDDDIAFLKFVRHYPLRASE